MIDVHNSSETSDFQSPAYDLYEINSVWTFKNIVRMLAGPKPAEREASSDPPWTKARDLIRHALIGAIESGRLVPINKVWLEEELRINASEEYVRQFEVNIYERTKFKREDVIVWSEKERIVDTLHLQGHQVPIETIELIEKIKRIDQIKSPDSEADKSTRSSKSFEGIFPAPEGTRWRDVHLTLEEKGSLKIKVKNKERTLNADGIKKHFPKKQQRDVLFRMIRAPGGAFDPKNFNELGSKAYENRKQIVYKLNKSLQELFGIAGNPIIFSHQNESYQTQFSVHSDWEPYDSSD